MGSRTIVCLLGLVAFACGPGGRPVSDETRVREHLGPGGHFEIDPVASQVDVTSRMGEEATRVEIGVLGGDLRASLDPDGVLALDELELILDDMTFHHPRLPPEGIVVTDLRASLLERVMAQATFGEDGSLTGTIVADVRFDWSLVDRGGTVPLAPQEIQGITLDLQVGPAPAGHLSLALDGGLEGRVWSMAGVSELRDLDLALVAAEVAPPIQ